MKLQYVKIKDPKFKHEILMTIDKSFIWGEGGSQGMFPPKRKCFPPKPFKASKKKKKFNSYEF